MAIVWADFPGNQLGIYGTSTANMLNGVWAAIEGNFSASFTAIVNDPDPAIAANGRVLRYNQSSATGSWSTIGARLTYPAAVSTAGVGFRLWCSALPIGDSARGNPHWSFRTSGNGVIATVRVGASGQLLAYNTAGTLVGESGPVIGATSYNHIETKIFRDATVGTLEIRVNGTTVLSLTNLALGANNVLNVFIGQESEGTQANSRTIYYKDMVFWNGLGSECNDFQGSISVHDLRTDADISLNWTPSTGSTGWDLIDETTPNDADYIAAPDPAPAAYVASLTDLPADVTSVRALLPVLRSVKTDGGDCNLQVGLTPNNVNWANGTDRAATVASTYTWDVSHISPATSSPWTPVEVNAAYVRVNRTL